MKEKYIIMQRISRGFRIVLFFILVIVPCSVYADDFEDDFINAESYEQDYQIDNQSNEDLQTIEDNQDQNQENSENEGFTPTPSPDPEQSYAEQDPEPLKNESNPSEDDDNAGVTEASDEQAPKLEASDYSEDLKDILNSIQNLQFTLMIVTGIIIGFFFVARILP